MALLYSWATKEYCLWSMTIGQLIMYHNIGIELKYPTPKEEGKGKTLATMSIKERKQAILKARELMKSGEAEARDQTNDESKAAYRDKYGDV